MVSVNPERPAEGIVTGITVHFEPADAHPVIGVVAPFDFALDDEYWRLLPAQVGIVATRTPYVKLPVGLQLAEAVSDISEVTSAVRALSAAHPAAVIYACTSGSFVDGLAGERRLREAIAGAAGAPAVTVSGALLDAITTIGVRTLAIGTPYDLAVTDRLGTFLAEAGHQVVHSACLGLAGDIAKVDRATVQSLAEAADSPDADAIFLSCTNLRTIDILTSLEQQLGKPVLSANQVAVWAALRAGSLSLPTIDQRLFRD